MKYIRTKNGRIGFVSSVGEYNANKPLVFYAKVNGKIFPNLELRDVQFADTIEELCDRFVIEYKQHNKQRILKTYIKAERNFLRDKMYKLNHIKNLYGAIWTDKGLIYVAKMNEKGELELL